MMKTLELQVVENAPGIVLLRVVVAFLSTAARSLVEVFATCGADAFAIFTAMKTLWER